MTPIMHDRENTIIRNIMSGNNRCGTLASAVHGDGEYFRHCVRPVLATYEDEAATLRQQRQEALEAAEQRRQALEYLIANIAIPDGAKAVIAPALGRPLT